MPILSSAKLFGNILVILGIGLTACKAPWAAEKKEQKKIAKKFGTNAPHKSLFHSLAVQQEMKQQFDGVLLCYEKISCDNISSEHFSGDSVRKLYAIDPESLYKERGMLRQAKQTLQILNAKSFITLTHSFSFFDGQKETLYNIYDKQFPASYNLYDSSKISLDRVELLLKSRLQTGKYTHIVLMSTGWNNEQEKSIFHYNNWLTSIKAAVDSNEQFRPLYVALTWPSFRASRFQKNYTGVDYFQSQNNSDEIGMTHMNYLIWQVLEPLAEFYKKPLIVLGHSFGARMLSRASYAAEYTSLVKKGKDRIQKIDCFIAFQGAYRLARHTGGSKNAGDQSIYTGPGPSPWSRFISTTSTNDVPIKAGKIFGGFMGGPVARDVQEDKFDTDTVNAKGIPSRTTCLTFDLQKLLILNASEIINDHQDVHNLRCGKLIWHYIRCLER
jgi:hypothetical protein